MAQAQLDTVLDKIVKVSGDAQALQQTLADSMPFLLNDLTPEARQELGYQMQELIHFCEFDQRTCDLRYLFTQKTGLLKSLSKLMRITSNFI